VLITGVIVSGVIFALALVMHIVMPTKLEVVYTLALLGAAVLIFTPYLRVLVALGAFFYNREYKFAILSLLVLIIMVLSLMAGLIFHIA
jgi:uncharacterized membrane protein